MPRSCGKVMESENGRNDCKKLYMYLPDRCIIFYRANMQKKLEKRTKIDKKIVKNQKNELKLLKNAKKRN